MSLNAAVKLRDSSATSLPVIAFLHFPPVWNGAVARNLIDLLHNYGVSRCYFGHIHSGYVGHQPFEFEGIEFRLISADHLAFSPQKVFV